MLRTHGDHWHFAECSKLIHFKEAVETKKLLHEYTPSANPQQNIWAQICIGGNIFYVPGFQMNIFPYFNVSENKKQS